jgi:hypothetical protein
MSGDRTILQSHPPVVPGATAARGMQPGAGNSPIDELCINTIRTLSMDAVQAANSGHPRTPMAMAPVAYCLWQRFLCFDPRDPIWPNCDRVLPPEVAARVSVEQASTFGWGKYVGATGAAETVCLLLEHLAANGRARSSGAGDPGQLRFSKV